MQKLRDIKRGDMVVCGDTGIKVINENNDGKEDNSFSFMNNYVSSERRNDMIIKELAQDIFITIKS